MIECNTDSVNIKWYRNSHLSMSNFENDFNRSKILIHWTLNDIILPLLSKCNCSNIEFTKYFLHAHKYMFRILTWIDKFTFFHWPTYSRLQKLVRVRRFASHDQLKAKDLLSIVKQSIISHYQPLLPLINIQKKRRMSYINKMHNVFIGASAVTSAAVLLAGCHKQSGSHQQFDCSSLDSMDDCVQQSSGFGCAWLGADPNMPDPNLVPGHCVARDFFDAKNDGDGFLNHTDCVNAGCYYNIVDQYCKR